MTKRFASVVALALSFFMGGVSRVEAQDPICIPNASGVPGDPGAPDWFSYAIGDPAPVPDDARWRGSLALGRAGEQLLVRMLRRTEAAGTFLYVSISTPIGPSVTSTSSYPADVRFAINDPVSNRTHAAVFEFDTGPANQTTGGGYPATFGAGPNTIATWTHDGTDWVPPVSAAPAWLGGTTRSWGRCSGSFCGWVLQFRVKVGAGADELDIGEEFRSWLYVATPLNASSSAEYTWPAAVPAPTAVGEPISSDFVSWQRMRREGTPCAAGISLDSLQIAVAHSGTTHPEDNRIRDLNQLHARPTNGMGSSVPANGVRARFRIANWGSAVGDSPEWRTVGPVGGGCDQATGTGGDVASAGNFDLSCEWNPSDAELCQYGIGSSCDTDAGTYDQYMAHQCVLVELSGTTATDTLFFSRASAYRNMDVVGASRFERDAMISVRGLDAIEGTTERDVYLAALRSSMPTLDERRQAEQGSRDDQGEDDQERAAGQDAPGPGAPALEPLRLRVSPKLVEAIREGAITLDEAAGRLPTFIVHVFHDTGRTRELRGVERRILAPQPTFGYFVQHQGPFYGWASDIEGAEELGPDFYRVSVQNDGSVVVNTVIEAVESLEPPAGPTTPPGRRVPSWIWILIAVILIALVVSAGVILSERD